MRTFLERAAALHARAAGILRANRMHSEAARADQFAARIRLMLDEPKETRRMHALAEAARDSADTGVLFERALEGVLADRPDHTTAVQEANAALHAKPRTSTVPPPLASTTAPGRC